MKYNSDSITTNVVNYEGVDRSYTLRWGIKSINTATGESTIGFSLRCNTSNPEADTVSAGRFIYSMNVNGTPHNWGSFGDSTVLEDGWVFISRKPYPQTGRENGFVDYVMKHDTNGAATLNLDLTIDVGTLHFEASGSWELPIIKTSYYLDVPDAYIGETATINVHYSGTAKWCTIAYEFGGFSGNVTPWETFEPTITWEIPPEFYHYVANTTRGYGLLTCTFYNNNAEVVMTSTSTFGVMVREETNKPILNPIAIDTNASTVAATGDNKIFVKYLSDVKLDPGATAQNGADIIYQEITYNANKTTALMPVMLEDIENPTFTFTSWDSRGLSSTTTVTSSILNYVELTCHISRHKLDAAGSMLFDIEGNYFNSDFVATDNTLTLEYRYRDIESAGFSAWAAATPSIMDNRYYANVVIAGLEYGKTYELQARATDKVCSVESEVVKLVSKTVFDWGENDFRFNVPVEPTGGIVLGKDESIVYGGRDDGTTPNILSHNNFGIRLGDVDYPNLMRAYAQDLQFNVTNKLQLYSDNLNYTENSYVNLIGLVNALTTTYRLDTSIYSGDTDDAWAYAYLSGTWLYVHFGMYADVANWDADISVTHDGKILSIPGGGIIKAVGVNTEDAYEGIFSVTAPSTDADSLTFMVKPQDSDSRWTGLVEMTIMIPVTIDPNAYVVDEGDGMV